MKMDFEKLALFKTTHAQRSLLVKHSKRLYIKRLLYEKKVD